MRRMILAASVFLLAGCYDAYQSPPAYQEQVIYEDQAPPVVVEEYYYVDGRYYYWHPGIHRYVVLRGEPPHGYRIIHERSLPHREARPEPRERQRQPAPRPEEHGNPRGQQPSNVEPQVQYQRQLHDQAEQRKADQQRRQQQQHQQQQQKNHKDDRDDR